MGELLRNAHHENPCGFSRNDERRAIPRKPQNLTIILKGDFIALLPSLRGFVKIIYKNRKYLENRRIARRFHRIHKRF